MKSASVQSSIQMDIKSSAKKHDHEQTMFRREIRGARLLNSPRETNTMISITCEKILDELPNMYYVH